jgi:hypothetical protein
VDYQKRNVEGARAVGIVTVLRDYSEKLTSSFTNTSVTDTGGWIDAPVASVPRPGEHNPAVTLERVHAVAGDTRARPDPCLSLAGASITSFMCDLSGRPGEGPVEVA